MPEIRYKQKGKANPKMRMVIEVEANKHDLEWLASSVMQSIWNAKIPLIKYELKEV
jgi:hypothetical protein